MRARSAIQDRSNDTLTIDVLQAELEATNREVLALTVELEERVDQRTAQLRAAQAELKATNEELRRLASDLEERVAQRTAELQKARNELELRVEERTRDLRAANDELEAFSYSVSHDLRAPLRAITGFASLLAQEYSAEFPEGARRYLEIIQENAERMRALIEDLLSLAHVGRQPLQKQRLKLVPLVEEVVAELKREQGDRQIEVKIGALPDCEADLSLLRQVFVNLLSNAFKFTRTRDSAVVEVDVRQEGKEQVYFVRDNGVGFDMQYAERLFGVFQRLHREKEFEGTGVGLSIIARIIKRHGGRIWAEAKPNEGATFLFTLPSRNPNPAPESSAPAR